RRPMLRLWLDLCAYSLTFSFFVLTDRTKPTMQTKANSIRPFIGARDFDVSRSFYRDLGLTEVVIDPHLSYFSSQGFGFYLQNAYVKDWVDNTMLFWEVEDVDKQWKS
ncbi:MAG: hypothetical protein J7527_05170, partial [Chitinophagaceae bacterium]|nr:hypothetical protein [Chitinophagaceae bacterium]